MRGFLTDRIGLKIISLLVAVLLEFYFYSPDNSIQAVLTASVEIKDLPAGMMIVSPLPGEQGLLTRFTVRGPRPLVEAVRASSHRFSVETPPGSPSSFRVNLLPTQLRLPGGVEVLDIEPNSFLLQLDKVIRKKLLVVVQKIGEPAAGFRLSESVVPENVTAEGPKGELDGLSIVQTERIDVGGLRESKQLSVDLVDKGPLTKLSENSVTVSLRVIEDAEERTFSAVHVDLKPTNGAAASIEPTTVDVVFSGPRSKVSSVAASELQVVVDATSFAAGRYELAPSVKLPEGMELVRINPPKITLNVVTHGQTVRD